MQTSSFSEMPLPTLQSYIRDLEIIAGRALACRQFSAAIRAKEAIGKAMGFMAMQTDLQRKLFMKRIFEEADPHRLCHKCAAYGHHIGAYPGKKMTPPPCGSILSAHPPLPNNPHYTSSQAARDAAERRAASEVSDASQTPPPQETPPPPKPEVQPPEEVSPFLQFMDSDPESSYQDTLVAEEASHAPPQHPEKKDPQEEPPRFALGPPLALPVAEALPPRILTPEDGPNPYEGLGMDPRLIRHDPPHKPPPEVWRV